VKTDHGTFTWDYVICATGVHYDLERRPELTGIAGEIALWGDRYTPLPEEAHPELARLPYLGHHFEYLEKRPTTAPWLAKIYAFNFSGFVSMGPVATSITGHRFGVPRLVHGITSSLFLEQAEELLPSLYAFDDPEIDPAAATMHSHRPSQDLAAE
jgi:hypothetical protein